MVVLHERECNSVLLTPQETQSPIWPMRNAQREMEKYATYVIQTRPGEEYRLGPVSTRGQKVTWVLDCLSAGRTCLYR